MLEGHCCVGKRGARDGLPVAFVDIVVYENMALGTDICGILH